MKLTFEIRLMSDYHIASGYGLGEAVDAALQRDTDGRPVIRGTTVVGLLRDGLRRLLLSTPALAEKLAPHLQAESTTTGGAAVAFCPDPDTCCPLCRLLGSPIRAKPWTFSSAHLTEALEPVRDGSRFGSQPVTRVRVDPTRRRALDKHLFTQEEGNRGLVFRFDAECIENDAAARRDAALLVAGARMVRRLGSARRRGRGECLWSLIQVDGQKNDDLLDTYLKHFKRWWLEDEPIGLEERPESSSFIPAAIKDVKTIRFRVLVRTDEPCVIADRPGAGNLFRTLDHITGSTLWGALASRMAGHLDLTHCTDRSSDPGHAAFVDLFLRGGLRVSPLFPANLDKSGDRAWQRFPAPLDLLTCKHVPGFANHDGHQAEGQAIRDEVETGCMRCGGPLEPPRGLLSMDLMAGIEPTGPALQEEMHPRIHPETQQVNSGDLFGYQALAPGQFFIGELWCRGEAAWEILRTNATITAQRLNADRDSAGTGHLRLGKAIRRGYGAVSLWLEELAADEPAFSASIGLEDRVAKPQQEADGLDITLGLISDAILPDPWGRYYGSLADPGFITELFDGLPARIETIQTFCRTSAVDGFAGHLGLPRWRDPVITAGSTVGLRLQPQPGASADWFDAVFKHLDRLERECIGLRREEGFGRIVFNHPIYGRSSAIPESTDIPMPFRLPKHAGGAEATRERLLRDWSFQLDRVLPGTDNAFQHPNWQAVARWLNAWAIFGFAGVKTHLETLGKVDLLHPLRADKPTWFKEKQGMKILKGLLVQIETLSEEAPGHEPELIRILAARIAAAAPEGDTE